MECIKYTTQMISDNWEKIMEMMMIARSSTAMQYSMLKQKLIFAIFHGFRYDMQRSSDTGSIIGSRMTESKKNKHGMINLSSMECLIEKWFQRKFICLPDLIPICLYGSVWFDLAVILVESHERIFSFNSSKSFKDDQVAVMSEESKLAAFIYFYDLLPLHLGIY